MYAKPNITRNSSLDLVVIAYAQKPPINAHTDQCIQRASGLNVGLSLNLLPFFVYASSEGSSEFALSLVQQCD